MSYFLAYVNGENQIVRQLVTFTKFYDGITLPLHPDTKATVDAFFGKKGAFVLLCDKIFGKFIDAFYEDEPEMCWMDMGNIAPHSALAKALFRCISPGTPFINFLEAVSTPSPTFAYKVRSGWKGSKSSSTAEADKAAVEGASQMYTADFPLSVFLQSSFRLLAESTEADLYTFTRSKIPSALLLPFWHPPLVTRTEESAQQVMTSLPCSPLAYFILRMLMYVVRRSEKDGGQVLSRRQHGGVRSRIRYCYDAVAWFFNRLPPTDFPFFNDIFTAYVQTYVTPALIKNLSSKLSIQDIQWTTSDVTATLLVCSSFVLSHRHVTQPLSENNRPPIYEPSQLAPVAVTLPFFTEMFIALHKGTGIARETLSPAAVPAGFSDDSVFKAADDVTFISQTLYRYSLIVLRETVMSLDGFPQCRLMHFNNALELWLTVMNPLWRVNGHVGLNYIARHYEAYSFITMGFLNLAVKSSMVGTLDRSGNELLAKCLTQLQDQQFTSLADAVHAASTTAEESVTLGLIKRNCVLSWGKDEGSFSRMDIRQEDVNDRAAQLFVMMERRCAMEENSYAADGCRECLTAVVSAFPGARDFLDKWRLRGTARQSAKPRVARHSRRASVDVSTAYSSKCLTEEEKAKFFKGVKRHCERYSDKVRLPTNNGRVHGGHHPSLRSKMYLEFPFLIGPTGVVDAGIERLMEAYYSSWIPKCEVGHYMLLVDTDEYCCSAHAGQVGIWECLICEVVYGSCCRNLPMTSDGKQLSMKRNADAGAICSRCGEFFDLGRICFASPQQEQTVYCSVCASRPFKPWSTRFLAAYSTWAAVIVAYVALYFIMSFFSE